MAPPTTSSPATNGAEAPCTRCKSSPGIIIGRNNEHLCSPCFLTYVRSKVIKRMDSFRVRHSMARSDSAAPLLLLPFSCGVSSLALLEMLHTMLLGQKKRVGRTGFRLLAVLVDDSAVMSGGEIRKQKFEEAERRFAAPEVEFMVVPLELVYTYGRKNVEEALAEAGVSPPSVKAIPTTHMERLQQLIKSLPSPSSASDILLILLNRLLIALAIDNDCHTILYGHSATRLAEKTIAETAKGRGGSLPWMTSDGTIPLAPGTTATNVNTLYPNRDILRKELAMYCRHMPELADLVFPDQSPGVQVSAKNIPIDVLVKQYFEGLEDPFPGIVANVVKTVGKLDALPIAPDETWCRICGLPRNKPTDLDKVHLSGDGNTDGGEKTADMCSGCVRSIEGMSEEIAWPL